MDLLSTQYQIRAGWRGRQGVNQQRTGRHTACAVIGGRGGHRWASGLCIEEGPRRTACPSEAQACRLGRRTHRGFRHARAFSFGMPTARRYSIVDHGPMAESGRAI